MLILTVAVLFAEEGKAPDVPATTQFVSTTGDCTTTVVTFEKRTRTPGWGNVVEIPGPLEIVDKNIVHDTYRIEYSPPGGRDPLLVTRWERQRLDGFCNDVGVAAEHRDGFMAVAAQGHSAGVVWIEGDCVCAALVDPKGKPTPADSIAQQVVFTKESPVNTPTKYKAQISGDPTKKDAVVVITDPEGGIRRFGIVNRGGADRWEEMAATTAPAATTTPAKVD